MYYPEGNREQYMVTYVRKYSNLRKFIVKCRKAALERNNMAYFKINLYMNAVKRYTTFDMFIPNEVKDDMPKKETVYTKRSTKTLFLLHGYTGNASNYVPEEMAEKYNFAIVMPTGENSFYLDGLSSDRQFQTMIKELVLYVRKTFYLAMCAEDTFICGMSMGGYGALHTAFAYPEMFSKAGAMSSALVIHDIAQMKENECNDIRNYEYYREIFGDIKSIENSHFNPEYQVIQLQKSGTAIPDIYMCCGLEDMLLEKNREFHNFLTEHNVKHVYKESTGNHEMRFWNEYVIKIVEWMFA